MNPLNLIADPYDRPARLYQVLLFLSPAIISAAAILSESLSALQSLGALAVGCGLSFLLTQLARDLGKQSEVALLQEWGGLPSVTIFRHRDARIDAITKARYHRTLAKLVKDADAPSADDESNNPKAADVVYTAWSTFLRIKTRDVKKYNLLFNENINYGYRRNVYGLRKLGIIITSVVFIATIAWAIAIYYRSTAVSTPVLGALAFDAILLVLWLLRFTSTWVRVPADAYAERLAEATDTLNSEKVRK
jgi:hypothetical protein